MGARRKNLHYFVLLLLIALWPTAHLYAAQSPQKTAKPNTVKVRISQSAVSARSTTDSASTGARASHTSISTGK